MHMIFKMGDFYRYDRNMNTRQKLGFFDFISPLKHWLVSLFELYIFHSIIINKS